MIQNQGCLSQVLHHQLRLVHPIDLELAKCGRRAIAQARVDDLEQKGVVRRGNGAIQKVSHHRHLVEQWDAGTAGDQELDE